VENLNDKKILDGFIGLLLPWNSGTAMSDGETSSVRHYHQPEGRQVNFLLMATGKT
jgi:hypothetical protein